VPLDQFIPSCMSYFTKTLQRLGIITFITLTPALTAWHTPLSVPAQNINALKVARAPTPPFALSGVVYVSQGGFWKEATLTGYRWHSNTGFQYTANYEGERRTEANIPIDRIITLAEAQQRKIATNVYEVSTNTGIQQMVNAHNSWRKATGVAPLSWSPKLASFAQDWANTLVARNEFKHRANNNYGENLAAAQGKSFSPKSVVEYWGEEVRDYDYKTNRCKPGEMCGHYTQLVWHKTKEVGCAKAQSRNKEVWVCNYNPPGNYVGQKPY
jgi:pathogenesis-related protein 1